MLALSLVGHLALLTMLLVERNGAVMALPGVVTVELVAAPAAAPRPAPAPKPVQKKVVLPAEPTTPKPAPREEKPEPAPVEEEPEPTPVEQDYGDVMAQLRADAEETANEPDRTAAAGSTGGIGRPVSPELAAWLKKAEIHVRRAWVLPPAFRTQVLEAQVIVELDAAGNVVGTPEVVRRSGNPWYDEGVVRSIQKASPLPPPPTPGEWSFRFPSEGGY